MTTPYDATEAHEDDLQFDEAEFTGEAPAGPVCAACKTPIRETYYAAYGNVFCPPCRERIESSREGGSRLGRVVKAAVLGTIAAVVGGLIYYGITKATGWNIGLVSVVVGLMIGGAVKAGSGNRGGWVYQLLAVFLTYTAIAGMIVPDLFVAIGEMNERKQAETLKQTEELERLLDAARQEEAAPPPVVAVGAAAAGDAELPSQVFAEPDDVKAAAPEPGEPLVVEFDEEPPTPTEFLLGLMVVAGIAFSLPVVIGVQSPISGLIYGFALWEAWKLNRRAELAFDGPYRIEDRAERRPGVEGPSHDA